MNSKRAQTQINKRKGQAEAIINDKDKSKRFMDDVEGKYNNSVKNKKTIFFTKRISEMKEYVPLLISLIRSYIKGEYKEIPVGAIIAIVAALIYFFSPVDIIPDFIPGFGYVDDAGVILFCVFSVKNDLDVYREWKTMHDNIIDVDPNN